MNIFGPKDRASVKQEPGLKECKVVLSRVILSSNSPRQNSRY